MGYSKWRNRIQKSIDKWNCFGYFGYGHGRAVNQFGESVVQNRSVCTSMCPSNNDCRAKHHAKMDLEYPDLARLVQGVVEKCQETKAPVVRMVVEAMAMAEANGIPSAVEVKKRLIQYGIEGMTDHYICGQFTNIQNGLNAVRIKDE
jgi:hypothetical protein